MSRTRLCSVLEPRKMDRPASDLHTNVQLTCGFVGFRRTFSVPIRQAEGSVVRPTGRKTRHMTVSELIDELRAMPPDATVTLFSRMDEPQHRRVERIELSTTKSDPSVEIVVLS